MSPSQLSSGAIAVDIESGEHGTAVTVPAIEYLRDTNSGIHIIPFHGLMDAKRAVQSGQAQALVSAADTRKIAAVSRHFGMLPGVRKVPLVNVMPTAYGQAVFLDMGTNVECHADDLADFALMGHILAQGLGLSPSPRVGILSNGEETSKGDPTLRQAHLLLLRCPQVNYGGSVEANFIAEKLSKDATPFQVIVTDGFTGNIALKAWEGVGHLFLDELRAAFGASLPAKVAGLLARPFIKRQLQRYQPHASNGAIMLGLNKVVVKSHGNTTVAGFANAVVGAQRFLQLGIIEKLAAELPGLQASLQPPSPAPVANPQTEGAAA